MRSFLRAAAVAAAAAATLTACGNSSPHPSSASTSPAAAASSPAAQSARAQADCSKLRSSAIPLAAVDQIVIREVSRIAGGGNASRAQVRQAKAAVTAELRAGCPEFAALVRQVS